MFRAEEVDVLRLAAGVEVGAHAFLDDALVETTAALDQAGYVEGHFLFGSIPVVCITEKGRAAYDALPTTRGQR